LPDVIACQAFKNCERILIGLKKNFQVCLEDYIHLRIFLSMDSPVVIPWKTYYKSQRETKWRDWLNKYVYIDVRTEDYIVKRFQSFQYFCKEGLIPFVESHGYNFNMNYHLANELENVLYHGNDVFNRQQPFYRPQSDRYKMDLDFDYYLLKGISDSDWERFWKDWHWMTDFHEDNFRNRLMIPIFVYQRLNLEISRMTNILTDELEEIEDSEDWGQQQTEQASDAIGQGKDKNSLY